jgi:hypothetical protein
LIIVNLPGGGVQPVGEDELLWMRKAFDSEWKGAVMLRLQGDRIYSVEKLGDLATMFRSAKVALAELSAPDAKVKLLVSAQGVRQVKASDPEIYHEDAKSIVSFGNRIMLAVREPPYVVKSLLKQAK